MKWTLSAAVLMLSASSLVTFADDPVQRAPVPPPNDPNAYQPQVMPKPLPPPGYDPSTGQMAPPPPPPPAPGAAAPSIRNEDVFVKAYVAHRSPRIMVFVNRTIQGDPLPKDGLHELIRVEEKQASTGAVNVSNNNTVNGNGQSTSAGYGGSSASNVNVNKNNSSSFSSNGPAEYTKTTSVKTPADKYDVFGATADDYQLIEDSLVNYFDNSGKVQIQDSELARQKLDREKILRIENGDPAANRLLATELQQDVLIRVTAKPTNQASIGPAVRLICRAVSTTDARILGSEFVDMPLPMSKTNINVYTRHLAEQLMGDMSRKWSQGAQYDPIEVRVYKTASVDDALKIRTWLQHTPGVQGVTTRGSTGGAGTSYAAFSVAFSGAPEDLYAGLKDEIGESQGLKAVDLQANTIDLEVTGQMNLVTTTRKTETTTTIKTTEEKKVEPINAAPAQ